MEPDEQPPTSLPGEDDESAFDPRGVETPKPGQGSFAPEVLAALAVQLLSLTGLGPNGSGLRGIPLSHSHYDYHFHDALKRAESLLKTASGRPEAKVHAYQLFDERCDPMTFGAVAERFEEVGWKGLTAGNSVEPIARRIFDRASETIDSKLKEFERVASEMAGTPINSKKLKAEVRRRIKSAFESCHLKAVVSDENSLLGKVVDYSMTLLLKELLLDPPNRMWGRTEAIFGYFTFRDYVWIANGRSTKIRPFELFLYAAQAGIEPEKLTRSEFPLGFIPNPPSADHNPSVLCSHRGAGPLGPEPDEDDQ